jgi:hypothetical protein
MILLNFVRYHHCVLHDEVSVGESVLLFWAHGFICSLWCCSSTQSHLIVLKQDKDGNNEIDFREFVMAMQYMSTSSSLLDAIDTAFASFDLNNDGGISREELRAVFRSQKRMNKYVNVFKRQVRCYSYCLT